MGERKRHRKTVTDQGLLVSQSFSLRRIGSHRHDRTEPKINTHSLTPVLQHMKHIHSPTLLPVYSVTHTTPAQSARYTRCLTLMLQYPQHTLARKMLRRVILQLDTLEHTIHKLAKRRPTCNTLHQQHFWRRREHKHIPNMQIFTTLSKHYHGIHSFYRATIFHRATIFQIFSYARVWDKDFKLFYKDCTHKEQYFKVKRLVRYFHEMLMFYYFFKTFPGPKITILELLFCFT